MLLLSYRTQHNIPYIKGKANIKLSLCTSRRNTEIFVMFHTHALRNVMTTHTAWDIHCNIKWFYYAIWPIVICNGILVQHPDDGQEEGEFY